MHGWTVGQTTHCYPKRGSQQLRALLPLPTALHTAIPPCLLPHTTAAGAAPHRAALRCTAHSHGGRPPPGVVHLHTLPTPLQWDSWFIPLPFPHTTTPYGLTVIYSVVDYTHAAPPPHGPYTPTCARSAVPVYSPHTRYPRFSCLHATRRACPTRHHYAHWPAGTGRTRAHYVLRRSHCPTVGSDGRRS